jgi:hypothetical protein
MAQPFFLLAAPSHAHLSLLFSSSFLFSFRTAEQSGPSFIDSSFTAHFLQLAACATNTAPSLAAPLAPRYTTDTRLRARVASVQPNSKVSCSYALFPANYLTCLTSSSPPWCWLWWHHQYSPRLLFNAAGANSVLQTCRVVRVSPSHRIESRGNR